MISVHGNTLYAIAIHKNRSITPFLTLRSHFENRTKNTLSILQLLRTCHMGAWTCLPFACRAFLIITFVGCGLDGYWLVACWLVRLIAHIDFWWLRCRWLSFDGFFTESIDCPAPHLLFGARIVVPLLICLDVSTILIPDP